MIFFKRFLGIGIINTIFAYIVFIILLQVLNYNISYTISFMATIILSYFLNSKYVFKQKVSLSKFIKFPLVYIVQYLFGIVVLNILNIYMNTSNYINMLIVTILSIPLTFILSKKIIGSNNAK
jgi:putative flippase GtrA